MAMIDALRIDLSTSPQSTTSPALPNVYPGLYKSFVEAGAYLTLMSNATGDCNVHVDGADEGSTGER